MIVVEKYTVTFTIKKTGRKVTLQKTAESCDIAVAKATTSLIMHLNNMASAKGDDPEMGLLLFGVNMLDDGIDVVWEYDR